MKKIICILSASVLFRAATAIEIGRMGIPSTSADWESITGMRLGEYKIGFADTKAAGAGWEVYYLDSFPCYGAGEGVRAWVSAKDATGFIRAICIARPKEIKLAYRSAGKNDFQGETIGVLSCKVEKDSRVKLSECGKESWADFAKD